MAIVPSRYPELDSIDAVFKKALKKGKSPKSNMARFWYEAIEFDRNPEKPSARARGDTSLRYFDGEEGYHVLGEVPGQSFKDKPPQVTCAALIGRMAASWDGPKRITFFYRRDEGGAWQGGYTIETSAENRDLVEARKPLHDRIATALQHYFAPGTERVALLYGLQSWEEPGPKLGIRKEEMEFRDLPADLAALLEELRELLRRHGFPHLYRAQYSIKKPNDRLREGDNIILEYHR